MCHVPFCLDHTSQPNVELLYNAEAHIAEGPFYDQDNRQLLWVNIVHVSLLLSKCIMVSTFDPFYIMLSVFSPANRVDGCGIYECGQQLHQSNPYSTSKVERNRVAILQSKNWGKH